MKSRIIGIALAVCVSLVSTSNAQPISKTREQRLVAVAKQLHLTREQEKQLIPILRAEEPKLQAIKNDRSLSGAEKLQQLRAVHDESSPQVKAILTPEQYQQLQAMRRERRAQLLMQAAKSSPHQGGAARSLTPPGTPQK